MRDDTVLRGLEFFDKEVNEVEKVMSQAVRNLIDTESEQRWLAQEVEWHIRGLVYHFKNMKNFYEDVCKKISDRAMIPQRPDVLIFHTPEMQTLLFEFYALVILSRVTLDHITQRTMAPLFQPGTLPGSVNKFLKGKSDMPLHKSLNSEPLVRYLIDIRDCVVHFKTFATTDNTIAYSDHMDEKELPDTKEIWKHPVTRTYFRVVSKQKISVNILLPDAIYEYNGSGVRGRMIRDFAYEDRRNILRESMDFIKICTATAVNPLQLIGRRESVLYTWQKR